jgi:hypothetical protein
MTKSLKTGHRIRLDDDERLDIPDALDLSVLPLDYANELGAALLGGSQGELSVLPVGGTLALLTFDTTTPAATVIGGPGGAGTAAMLMHTLRKTSGEHEAEVLLYDPGLSGQPTTVDLSAFVPGDTPIVWARREDWDDDTDTRRKWDIASSQEIVFSLNTRERYRVLFEATAGTTPPDTDIRWFAVAQVLTLVGSVYTWDMIHPFDCGYEPKARTDYEKSWGRKLRAGDTAYSFIGMAQAARELLELARDETVARAAADLTLTGVDANQQIEIDANTAGVAANAADVATTNGRVGALEARLHAMASGAVLETGGAYAVSGLPHVRVNLASATAVSPGVVDVLWDTVALSGYQFNGVQVTPMFTSSYASLFIHANLLSAGNGVRVRIMRQDTVPVDASFFITFFGTKVA